MNVFPGVVVSEANYPTIKTVREDDYAPDEPTAWPLGVAVGIALFAAADRTTAVYGLAAGVTGTVGALAIALWWLVPGSPLAAFPPLLSGLGVGTVANRLLFGVCYSLPEARRRRENIV